MDFTLKRYKEIIETFKKEGYSFFTFNDFIKKAPKGRVIILRHDVDRYPKKALTLARIEREMNIGATYYFRIVRGVFRPRIIKEIVELGHEIGYHYEDLNIAKGNSNRALLLFKTHLEKLRCLYPVTTISMHGSPLSRIDNKLIWKKYDYRDYGIIAEPNLDVDYSQVLYITDTGRRWNDDSVNIRDKVEGLKTGRIKSSNKILEYLTNKHINDIVMLNTHPNRWHDNVLFWTTDFIFQFLKNLIKALIIRFVKDTEKES